MPKKFTAAGALAGAVLLAACSSSAPVGSGGEVAAAEDAADPRKCKYVTPIGSRIGQRVCMKRSEWERMAENARKATKETQQRANQVGNPTGT
jgi:hypothetical protein